MPHKSTRASARSTYSGGESGPSSDPVALDPSQLDNNINNHRNDGSGSPGSSQATSSKLKRGSMSDDNEPYDPAWMDRETLLHFKRELGKGPARTIDATQAKNLVAHGLAAFDRLDRMKKRSQLKLIGANATINRLETELNHLPTFYTARAKADQERLENENKQLHVQTRALMRKIAQIEEEKIRLLVEVKTSKAAAAQQARLTAAAEPAPAPRSMRASAPVESANENASPQLTRNTPKEEDDDMAALVPPPLDAEQPATSIDTSEIAMVDTEVEDNDEGGDGGAPIVTAEEGVGAAGTAGRANEEADVDLVEARAMDESPPKRVDSLTRQNHALRVDKRLLIQRLKAAESQITRAERQLRDLRAGMLQGVPLVTVDHRVTLPTLPGSTTDASAGNGSEDQQQVMLGDAEAELLLQAAKTHSHVNRINRVPLSRALQAQAQQLVRLANTSGELAGTLRDRADSSNDSLLPPPLAQGEGSSADVSTTVTQTGESAAAKAFDLLNKESLSMLLQLAQDAPEVTNLPALPPLPNLGAPIAALSRSPFDVSSHENERKKRRRTRSAAATDPSWDPARPWVSNLGSKDPGSQSIYGEIPTSDSEDSGADSDEYLPSPPSMFSAGEVGPSRRHGHDSGSRNASGGRALGPSLSALDVLAQASASQEAADYSLPSPKRASTSGLQDRKPKSAKSLAKVQSRSASTVGPDGRKVRSAYIKWNSAEDEMLLRAIIKCGCAWDEVAKLCPTRAYHQVRQRFLRGLKSGESLPEDLQHLKPAVLQAVADFEAKRKRKKYAKQAAQRAAEDALLYVQ